MGLGMELMEQTVADAEHGGFLNHDLAQYHFPVCAGHRIRDLPITPGKLVALGPLPHQKMEAPERPR